MAALSSCRDTRFGLMLIFEYSARGWETWDLDRRPMIRDGMPVLIDQDLAFETAGVSRPSVSVNRWLRQLPTSGAPSKNTWWAYARAMRAWLEHLEENGVDLFDSRAQLRDALSAYAGERLGGDLAKRLSPASWNQHITTISKFYQWAIDENLTACQPFTYSTSFRNQGGRRIEMRRNNAALKSPQRHSTIKYLDREFTDIFIKALAGLAPDDTPDRTHYGRELGRNSAIGALAVSTGLRRQEFTYLLTYELPPLPPKRSNLPVLLPVASSLAKGQKLRTTWIDYDALANAHQYVNLERRAAISKNNWKPSSKLGAPLLVEKPDFDGAHVNGTRVSWRSLAPKERLRLVSPEGTTCLISVQSSGDPFKDWPTVFIRTSRRIREQYEPRFPDVSPHRLRHTFAMHTLERLVSNHYNRAAQVVTETRADASLSMYLTKSDPLMVLRDLLGHSSVTTTQAYLDRLDVTRIYKDAYEAARIIEEDSDGAVDPSRLTP